MKRFLVGLLVLVPATSIEAQQNPFKLPKSSLKAEVTYELGGDSKGTAMSAFDGDRYVRSTTSTTKMMGKETNVSTWSLFTPDAMYHADLLKKTGTKTPNMLPAMAKAYDELDGDSKRRFHQNMQDMAGMMTKMFEVGGLSAATDKKGEKTIAGEVCEERQFGPISVCNMKKAPRIPLESSGDLLCFSFRETATSVKLGSPSERAFAMPDGITFADDPRMGATDSIAHGFVGYLASQQLADSVAKGKQQLEEAKAKADGKPTEMTKEQKDQVRQACDMVKNLDMNKVLANAFDAMIKGLKDSAVESAKQSVGNKLRGMIKKPRIP